MIYARITHGITEDSRLEVDAILGDPDALAERARLRREAILAFGGEIG